MTSMEKDLQGKSEVKKKSWEVKSQNFNIICTYAKLAKRAVKIRKYFTCGVFYQNLIAEASKN